MTGAAASDTPDRRIVITGDVGRVCWKTKEDFSAMSEGFGQEREVAEKAVQAAALLCRRIQGTITEEVLEKKDRSPVTVADFGSQAVVCRILEQEFPDDPVIGEEDSHELQQDDNRVFLDAVCSELAAQGIDGSPEQVCRWIDRGGAHEYSDRFWTLDPIDGTKGFLRGGQYAVSLALIVQGEIKVAALACPNLPLYASDDSMTGVVFTAIRGAGCHVTVLENGRGDSPVESSRTENPSEARFCESVESGHSSHSASARIAESLGITQPPVRLDSQAKYAVVARGEADIYLRLPTRPDYTEKIWDHAGGVLVVEEAGGTVTDVYGKPLEFTHGHELSANKGVVVTNGPLHDDVLQALRKLESE